MSGTGGLNLMGKKDTVKLLTLKKPLVTLLG